MLFFYFMNNFKSCFSVSLKSGGLYVVTEFSEVLLNIVM
jgi:hypothetical protein